MRLRAAERPKLTAEQREQFAKPVGEGGQTLFDRLKCVHCGGVHMRACPRVKRLAFGSGGAISEVEFWPEGQWSDAGIIWPEDVHGDPGGNISSSE